MSVSGTVGIWVGIFAFILIMLGGLERAARTTPSVSRATSRPMAEDRIFRLATAILGVFAIALMVWVALSG
jgi:hypothetical protein